MKQLLLALLLASTHLLVYSSPRVLLPGDWPDPSIVRVGQDFYMTHSPFRYKPGFLIWHSTDLMHWQPLCHAAQDWQGSAMAPDLVHHQGRFYIYFPAEQTNWVIWADDIRGPWSEPIDLHVGGIDPGHVVDEDGGRHLFLSEGHVVDLSPDGLSTVGERRKVYDGWDYPRRWQTEGKYLESPKLLRKDGWYYMTSAEGGTAGPATSHMVIAARSHSIDGPWENSPYNPIVRTYDEGEPWWSKGHGTVIDDAEGNWWVVYHAYANGYHTLGRQTLIEPIEWTADGWYRAGDWGIRELGNWELPDVWVSWNGHKLMTASHKNYEVSADLAPTKRKRARLALYYNENAWAGLTTDGRTVTIHRSAKDSTTLSMPGALHVTLHNQGNILTIKANGKVLAEGIDVSTMNHNVHKGFFALRPAYLDNGTASNVTYRDASPKEEDMAAYLMVFHQDEDHSLHMAVSRDGYTFTAVNGGKPTHRGADIAEQRGIRDPHIMRGPDGAFYLSMTDLHVFGQRDGYRDTEWQRPKEQYAWGNNRALVLMKSWDLVHWTHTILRVDELGAQFADIGCAWAPATVYDPAAQRLMITFTMRYRNERNALYYAYVNEDFTALTSAPKPLYEYPHRGTTAIDGDLTLVGDTWRLFYVSHDGVPGIRQSTSRSATGPWTFDGRYYDDEPGACEAPNVWKRIGEDRWVLMYDVYSLTPHNFGFMETTDFVNFTPLGHFNEGVMRTEGFASPKHGAVIQITQDEADRLINHWQ